MAERNWSVVRVEKISAEGAQKTERHNERKNESYANLNVDTERITRNVHFKDTGGLTYNEYFQRLIDDGKISTRGQKAGATIFNELVIDVNTRYFEEHGGYEYARQFYEEAYRPEGGGRNHLHRRGQFRKPLPGEPLSHRTLRDSGIWCSVPVTKKMVSPHRVAPFF